MVVAVRAETDFKKARVVRRDQDAERVTITIRFDPEFTSPTCPAGSPSEAASVISEGEIQSCKTILESARTDDRLLVRREPAPAKDKVTKEADSK
jgi:hypothetical protein